jgi:tetratricopeptide (TPR) repeat protein
VATEIGSDRLLGAAVGQLAEVASHQQRYLEAEQGLRRALELLDPYPTFRADALGSLARLRVRQGRPDDALELIEQAERVGERHGGLGPTEFRLAVVRIEALRRLGRADEAAAQARAAAARLQAQAGAFSDQGVRDGFLHGVPAHARILQLAVDAEG